MKKTLFIRLLPGSFGFSPDTKISCFVFDQDGKVLEPCINTSFGQLPEKLQTMEHQTDKTVLSLPSEFVTLRQITINEAQRKHLSQVLPFLLEEELAIDIDAIHLAYNTPDSNNSLSAAIINREDISQLISLLESGGINANHIYPESQLLLSGNLTETLIVHDNKISIKSEGFTGSLPCETAEQLLPAVITTKVSCFAIPPNNESASANLEAQSKSIEWLSGYIESDIKTLRSLPELLIKSLSQSRQSAQLIDLRQGQFQCPEKKRHSNRYWKPLLATTACWLLLDLGISVAKGVYFNQENNHLWQKSASLYLKAFPRDQQVKSAVKRQSNSVNLRSRLASRLKPVQDTNKKQSVLPVIQQLSVVYSSFDDLKIQPSSLDYETRSNKLIFEFQAQDLERIEKFQTALKASGLNIHLDSAQQEDERVTARMTIKG